MSPVSKSRAVFKERLYPKVSGLLPLVLLVPATWLVVLPIAKSDVGLLIGVAVFAVATLTRFLAAKVTLVLPQEVLLGVVQIPLDAIESLEILDKYQIRSVLGPDSNARAHLHFSASANYAVMARLKKNQAYPYLLISTNKPDRLKKSLEI